MNNNFDNFKIQNIENISKLDFNSVGLREIQIIPNTEIIYTDEIIEQESNKLKRQIDILFDKLQKEEIIIYGINSSFSSYNNYNNDINKILEIGRYYYYNKEYDLQSKNIKNVKQKSLLDLYLLTKKYLTDLLTKKYEEIKENIYIIYDNKHIKVDSELIENLIIFLNTKTEYENHIFLLPIKTIGIDILFETIFVTKDDIQNILNSISKFKENTEYIIHNITGNIHKIFRQQSLLEKPDYTIELFNEIKYTINNITVESVLNYDKIQ